MVLLNQLEREFILVNITFKFSMKNSFEEKNITSLLTSCLLYFDIKHLMLRDIG